MHLKKSLDSIKDQSHTNFEVIIVDESTDQSCSFFCENYVETNSNFRYIRPSKRLGLPASLNLAIEHAQYELIARFDADDICHPERLKWQVDFFNTHPDVEVLGGYLDIIDNDDNDISIRRYPQESYKIAYRMQLECAIAHPTVMFKKVLYSSHGGYNPQYSNAEDLELWLRWLNKGVIFRNLALPLIKYRQNDFVRHIKHYKYSLRARLKTFNFRYFPLNVLGIVILSVIVLSPNLLLEIYYFFKYKRESNK
jgi:glycosyltransferase involved in cell wall biosynthesis